MIGEMLVWEHHLWTAGYQAIAGVDEVGRGALAGPLMAGAVILPPLDVIISNQDYWDKVNDSKTLTPNRRATLASFIREHSLCWGIGSVEADELDEIGVAAANRIAMERAILALATTPDFLFLDATTVDLGYPQSGIIDGDALSLSIAAASILAKHARDKIMIELDSVWPAYGFASHKGYASQQHRTAIAELGPCPIHRHCYAPVRAAAEVHGYAR